MATIPQGAVDALKARKFALLDDPQDLRTRMQYMTRVDKQPHNVFRTATLLASAHVGKSLMQDKWEPHLLNHLFITYANPNGRHYAAAAVHPSLIDTKAKLDALVAKLDAAAAAAAAAPPVGP